MMNKRFSKTEMKGLPGGPNEQFTYVTGVFLQDMYSFPQAQEGLEKYQVKGEFVPNIAQVPKSSTSVNAPIIMSPEELNTYNKSNYNKEGLISNIGRRFNKLWKRKSAIPRKISTVVDNMMLSDNEVKVDKSKYRFNDLDDFGESGYLDLSDEEFGTIVNYLDSEKMDSIYNNFDAKGIIGGDYIDYLGRPTRTALEFKNMNWDDLVNKNDEIESNNKSSYLEFEGFVPDKKNKDSYFIGKTHNKDGFNIKEGYYYGTENGKFKVGTLDKFKNKTLITPMRHGYRHYTKENPPVFNLEKFYNKNSKPHLGETKQILFSPSTGATGFTYTPEGIINFYKKYGDVIPVYFDHGSYEPFMLNEDPSQRLNYSDYQDYMAGMSGKDRDIKGVRNMSGVHKNQNREIFGTNIFIKQTGGEGLEKYQVKGEKKDYEYDWQEPIFDAIEYGSNKVPANVKNNVFPMGNNTYEASPYSLPVAEVWGRPINTGRKLLQNIGKSTGYIADQSMQLLSTPEALASYAIDKYRGKNTEMMDVLPSVVSDVIERKGKGQPDIVTSIAGEPWVQENPFKAIAAGFLIPGFRFKKPKYKKITELDNIEPEDFSKIADELAEMNRYSDKDLVDIWDAGANESLSAISKKYNELNQRTIDNKYNEFEEYKKALNDDFFFKMRGDASLIKLNEKAKLLEDIKIPYEERVKQVVKKELDEFWGGIPEDHRKYYSLKGLFADSKRREAIKRLGSKKEYEKNQKKEIKTLTKEYDDLQKEMLEDKRRILIQEGYDPNITIDDVKRIEDKKLEIFTKGYDLQDPVVLDVKTNKYIADPTGRPWNREGNLVSTGDKALEKSKEKLEDYYRRKRPVKINDKIHFGKMDDVDEEVLEYIKNFKQKGGEGSKFNSILKKYTTKGWNSLTGEEKDFYSKMYKGNLPQVTVQADGPNPVIDAMREGRNKLSNEISTALLEGTKEAIGYNAIKDIYERPRYYTDEMRKALNDIVFLNKVPTANYSDLMNLIELAPGVGVLGKGAKKAGKALTKGPLKNAYKLNPRALKENPEEYLYRAQEVGQNPYKNMAAQLREKLAAGEKLKWYQKNLLNPQTDPKMIAREKYYGQWFENDPSRLDYYLSSDKIDEAAEILRIKLPKSQTSKFNVSNFDDANMMSFSPETEFVLPKQMVGTSEKFSPSSFQQLIEQDKAFNTPHWLKGFKKSKSSSIPPSQQTLGNLDNASLSTLNDSKPVVTPSSIPSQPATVWQMEELPGLHLKSTMSSNPKGIHSNIRKSDGTINTKTVLDQIKKKEGDVKYNEWLRGFKDTYGEELQNIPKRMDYNEFVKTGQKGLIDLDHKLHPNIKDTYIDKRKQGVNYKTNELLDEQVLILSNKNKFGRGSQEHGNPNETLGHLQLVVTKENPDVLTTLGIQSDAFQGPYNIMPKSISKEKAAKRIATMDRILEKQEKLYNETKKLDDNTYITPDGFKISKDVYEQGLKQQYEASRMMKAEIENFSQKKLLEKSHEERYLQELVSYAANRGDINKIRVPTKETAAKVQGYTKQRINTDPNFINPLPRNATEAQKKAFNKYLDDIRNNRSVDYVKEDYGDTEKTILKKYLKQPKTIKKLFGKEPQIVKDNKGNTWYEFDIPESFKKGKGQIKAYKKGGEPMDVGDEVDYETMLQLKKLGYEFE